MRVLIVRLSAFGDVIHALPLAANLARAGHAVGWLIETAHAPLLAGNPNVARLFPVDTRRWRRRPLAGSVRREVALLREEMRAFSPDAVLDVQANGKSWWVGRVAAAPRLVLDDRSVRRHVTRRFSVMRVAPSPDARHVCEKALALLGPLGVPAAERVPDARYLLASPAPAADAFLDGLPRPYALYHPGAGWANKCWGEERFALLARALAERRGLRPVVSWGPGDEVRARRLAFELSCPMIPPSSVPDLARIVSEASLFVAGDTGPLHLADALSVRTVALLGPTDPARTGPARGGLAFSSSLACAPCNRRYGQTKPCLAAIVPGAVADAVETALSRA